MKTHPKHDLFSSLKSLSRKNDDRDLLICSLASTCGKVMKNSFLSVSREHFSRSHVSDSCLCEIYISIGKVFFGYFYKATLSHESEDLLEAASSIKGKIFHVSLDQLASVYKLISSSPWFGVFFYVRAHETDERVWQNRKHKEWRSKINLKSFLRLFIVV